MILFVFILVLIIFIINESYIIENFGGYPFYQSFIPMNWYWNSLGTTTNMSYDLRGDPIVIPKNNFIWNNSSLFPIHNRPLYI